MREAEIEDLRPQTLTRQAQPKPVVVLTRMSRPKARQGHALGRTCKCAHASQLLRGSHPTIELTQPGEAVEVRVAGR